MKLAELKRRTWRQWEKSHSWKGQLTSSPDSYVADIKFFGDLRYKATWERALAKYIAQRAYEGCLDSWMLPLYMLNFQPSDWEHEFRYQILDEFLLYPDGLYLIKQGIEDVFQQDLTNEEEKRLDGFFGFLAEKKERDRTIGGTNGSLLRLPTVATTKKTN